MPLSQIGLILIAGVICAAIVNAPSFAYYFIVTERPLRIEQKERKAFYEFCQQLANVFDIDDLRHGYGTIWCSDNGLASLRITRSDTYNSLKLALNSYAPVDGGWQKSVKLIEYSTARNEDPKKFVELFYDTAALWKTLLSDYDSAWSLVEQFDANGMAKIDTSAGFRMSIFSRN